MANPTVDFTRRYVVTIGYLEAPSSERRSTRGSRRREWTFITTEISEDDAIGIALREFRREERRTWVGWPRDVIFAAVGPEQRSEATNHRENAHHEENLKRVRLHCGGDES